MTKRHYLNRTSILVFLVAAYVAFRLLRLITVIIDPSENETAWNLGAIVGALVIGAAVRWKIGPIILREPTPAQLQEEAYYRDTRSTYFKAIIPLLLIAGGLVALVAALA